MEKKQAPKRTQKKQNKKVDNVDKPVDKFYPKEKIEELKDKKVTIKVTKEIRLGQEVLIPFKKIEQFGGEILGRIQCDKRLDTYYSIWFDIENFIERNERYYVKGIVESYKENHNWEIRFSRKNSYFTININENVLEGIE